MCSLYLQQLALAPAICCFLFHPIYTPLHVFVEMGRSAAYTRPFVLSPVMLVNTAARSADCYGIMHHLVHQEGKIGFN